ncbi:MAG: rod shape-determining protein RodA [Bacteroidaceae bacterium]|nr:rod shape-determining protein RodA [Bacteroidaceae bacterium]MBR1521772.1 rod shape-determining protein RodA [Bacteroidaceae bacterium]
MEQGKGNKGIFLSIDWVTILLYVILIVWGWFSVCGACYDFNNPDLFAWETNSGKQIVWGGTSLVLAAVLMLIEKRFYDTAAYVIYGALMLLLAVTIVIAPDTKGSRSWLPIGPVKLQPAEFAKFAVALALGKLMDRYGFSIKKPKDIGTAIGLILLPMVLIICQKETGSALVYFAFFLMLYREGMTGSLLFSGFACVVYFVVGMKFADEPIANMPVSIGEFTVLLLAMLFSIGMVWVYCHNWKAVKIMAVACFGATLLAMLFSIYVIPFDVCYVMLGMCILLTGYIFGLALYTRIYKYALIGAFALLSTSFFYITDFMFDHLGDHQRVRIEVLLGMKDDPRGAGYNVNQAKIAIGSGGLTGKGFLNGTQTKLKYVPEQHTDFIFCTVGEEEGFVGSAGVLIVYLFFIWRLIALAERQPDTMGRVYGYCVLSVFLFHLFINVGMVLGLTPVIGIPLPFFSYGGSSLWGFTLLLFIFLRMDAERNLKKNYPP